MPDRKLTTDPNVTKAKLLISSPVYKESNAATRKAMMSELFSLPEMQDYNDATFNTFINEMQTNRSPKPPRMERKGTSVESSSLSIDSISTFAKNLITPTAAGLAGEKTFSLSAPLRQSPHIGLKALGYTLPLLAEAGTFFAGRKTEEAAFGHALGGSDLDKKVNLEDALYEGMFGRGMSFAGRRIGNAADIISGQFRPESTFLGKKFLEKNPKNLFELKKTKDAARFAEEYQLPFPTAFVAGSSAFADTAHSSVRYAKKMEIINKQLTGLQNALDNSFGGRIFKDPFKSNEFSKTTLETARELRNKLRLVKKEYLGAEKGAYKLIDEDLINIPTPSRYIAEEVDAAGNKTGIIDFIAGGVDYAKLRPFLENVNEQLADIFTAPASFHPGGVHLATKIEKAQTIIKELATRSADASGKFVIPYKTSKALRDAFRTISDNAAGENKARIHGISETIMEGLSAAENESVKDLSLGWTANSANLMHIAKKSTMARLDRFGYGSHADKIVKARSLSDPTSREIVVENAVRESLKSAEEIDRLIKANNYDPDLVNSIFVKDGFQRAMNPDGTINGQKFWDYFHDGANNESIFRNSRIFDKQQRDVIKGIANYARAGKFSERAGMVGFQNARITSASIYLSVGAATAFATGVMPGGLYTAAAISFGIPITRRFVEGLMLDERAGKAFLGLLNPASSQQAQTNTMRLLKHLPRGLELYMYGNDGKAKPGTLNANGRIELDKP